MKDTNDPGDAIGGLQANFRDAREHTPSLLWNYAVKGWLRRGETSVLYGPSNCGKSALVCHVGSCIAAGRTCFGARVRKGIVVHVAAEAPASVLDRMQAYDIHDPTTAPYLVRTGPVDLSDPDAVYAFQRCLEKIQADTGEIIVLIVFDTLARSIGHLDENCSTSMTGVAETTEKIARATNAHVMLVHHTGKDADRGGRGSSALRGAVDTEICLKPGKAESIAVSQDKQRTLPKLSAVHFRTEAYVLGADEDGEDLTTVRAVELSGPPDETTTASGKQQDHRTTAVLTALHIRRMLPELASKSFRTGELVGTLPPSVFEGVAAENRNRTVTRILDALAQSENPQVLKGKGEWRLAPLATRSSVD